MNCLICKLPAPHRGPGGDDTCYACGWPVSRESPGCVEPVPIESINEWAHRRYLELSLSGPQLDALADAIADDVGIPRRFMRFPEDE